MGDFRVILTGSRRWEDREAIAVALANLASKHGSLTVVHGDCPTGADRIAAEWCESVQRDVLKWGTGGANAVAEPHPADWRHCSRECNPAHRKWRGDETYCPTAGHRRNQEMADAGADLVLAFPIGKSPGTRDMIKRAQAAGLRVEVYEG